MARTPWLRFLPRPARPARRPPRPPLRLEALEERTLPAAPTTLQAVTLASGALPTASAAAGVSGNASVSADGRFVAFESTADNLVPGQAAGPVTSNVFLLDRASGAATLVSHAAGSATTGGDADSFGPVVSGNGRFVYFLSKAGHLLADEAGPATQNLYAYDVAQGTTQL